MEGQVRQDHVFYRSGGVQPPVAVRGEGVYLYDAAGRRYIDATASAGVVSIGHGVRSVVEQALERCGGLTFVYNRQFTTAVQQDFADEVIARCPWEDGRVFFTSGGSEATETAIKLARLYQLRRGEGERHRVVSLWQSYHGNSLGALSVSGRASWRREYAPLLLDFPHIQPAYCFRCPYRLTYPACDVHCAQELDRVIHLTGPSEVAAFFFEPVVGGSITGLVPPEGWFQRVRSLCDRHGILMVADEVFSGWGRTGSWLAMEQQGVIPDMVLLGKGIAGGYAPLGAVAVRAEVAQVILGSPVTHGFTYSGNPLACAVGLEVTQYIDRHGLVARAREMGEYLQTAAQRLKASPLVGDVRGQGLMLGVELVADAATRTPFPPERRASHRLIQLCAQEGVLLLGGATDFIDGVQGDQVQVCPPLVIEQSEIDEVLAVIAAGLGRLAAEMSR